MSDGFSATRVLAVLVKEFKQLTRDRITYAMILVLPVVQLLLFGYAINSEPRHLPTAVPKPPRAGRREHGDIPLPQHTRVGRQ